MGGDILFASLLLIIFVLVIISLILGVFWLVRQNSGTQIRKSSFLQNTDQDETMQILRRRYASGEINREQYEEMREDLSQ